MKEHKQLKVIIKTKYKHYYELAEVMGINRVTLAYKLGGFRPFTIDEIRFFHQHFNLTDEQVVHFFHL